METVKCGRYYISIVKGDITGFRVDAIVNAANKFLRHGGGVAGAILKRGGPIIQIESDKIIRERGPLNVGDAVYTPAGNLEAKIVIHTVGPIYGEGGEYKKIYTAVMNSLTLADELGMRSIAFPAISTGVYKVPPKVSAEAMLSAVIDYS
ncbi:TPA: macro domain-containing protein, partial [Candidatus Geothermarchaeota archaeon]|nr:macro domain-containing protein [Candidatus Geothermarchaeota archaeon]